MGTAKFDQTVNGGRSLVVNMTSGRGCVAGATLSWQWRAPNLKSTFGPLVAADALKAQTQPMHRLVDRHPLMQRVVAKDLTLIEYAQVLDTLACWHQCMYPVLSRLSLNPSYFAIDKIGLLLSDLGRLPYTPARRDISPLSQTDEAYGLGVLYVTEGATLGAQFIAPRVEATLGSQCFTHYYRAYGPKVLANWQTTQEILNSRLSTEKLCERAIVGAKDAFSALLELADYQLPHPVALAEV